VHVFLDGLWGGEARNVSLLVAIGVNRGGFSQRLVAAEGSKEVEEVEKQIPGSSISETRTTAGSQRQALGGCHDFAPFAKEAKDAPQKASWPGRALQNLGGWN
jgi:hypothetical protein